MQLISEEYKALNEKLHTDNKHYGRSGYLYVKDILKIATQFNTQDILDYGCGKSTLAQNLSFTIKQYDPAITKYKTLPEPSDIVVCTDVLEHIEPEYIDNVLDHIKSLTKKCLYISANVCAAKKTLSDGRNAHLIIENPAFWLHKMLCRFDIITYVDNGNNLLFVAVPMGDIKRGKEKKENEALNESNPTKSERDRREEGVVSGKNTDFLIL